jgi:hypothetical protein
METATRAAMRRAEMALRHRGSGRDKRGTGKQRGGKNEFAVFVHGFHPEIQNC